MYASSSVIFRVICNETAALRLTHSFFLNFGFFKLKITGECNLNNNNRTKSTRWRSFILKIPAASFSQAFQKEHPVKLAARIYRKKAIFIYPPSFCFI
jgi:hypothetical protein